MARPGPQAKSVKHGHGGAGFIDVPNVPYDGPGAQQDLPAVPGITWLPQVEGWWEIVRRMPHCVLWEASDWLYAIETAFLKQQYYTEYFGGVVHATMAVHLCRREDQMGTTMEARRKLGIRYVDPATSFEAPAAEQPEAAGNVADIAQAPSRRARLAG